VPLHRLPEHRCVDRGGRQGDGELRSRVRTSAYRDQGIFMYEFKYHRPATVRQAANLLVKNEDAKVIAGGHTLLPVMKQRLASPPHLVDLSHIEGLDGIEMKGRSLVIGATAKHANVATSAVVGEAIPALAELAGMIGDPAVRHKGTIGGSLANNDPTADYPAAVLALGATIVTNKRRLKAEEYFQGLFTTALESDEIITKVMFPLPKKAAYIKFRNQASRYALVGVFVAKRPSDVRVAVTGAGSEGVFRVTSFEEALKKRFSPKVLDGLTVPAEGLNSDLHGSAEYRAHLISVLARRAVEAATGKA
jgi:carbon-monoxide dehydrogenase medium subunit